MCVAHVLFFFFFWQAERLANRADGTPQYRWRFYYGNQGAASPNDLPHPHDNGQRPRQRNRLSEDVRQQLQRRAAANAVQSPDRLVSSLCAQCASVLTLPQRQEMYDFCSNAGLPITAMPSIRQCQNELYAARQQLWNSPDVCTLSFFVTF
jgi:hypothetical protein